MKNLLILLCLMYWSSVVFSQGRIDLTSLKFENGTILHEEEKLEITQGNMISIHRLNSFKPDSLKFQRFTHDDKQGDTYYFSPHFDLGLLIYDQEIELLIYCDYDLIIAICKKTESIVYIKSKSCGIPTFAFDNCGFVHLEYNHREKSLRYRETGIFNNSREKVLNFRKKIGRDPCANATEYE